MIDDATLSPAEETRIAAAYQRSAEIAAKSAQTKQQRKATRAAQAALAQRMLEAVRSGTQQTNHDLHYSVIYFVRSLAFVKIGVCREAMLTTRLGSFLSHNPHEVELLGTVPGGRDVELELLMLLKKAGMHHRGEWFHLTAPLNAAIASTLTAFNKGDKVPGTL